MRVSIILPYSSFVMILWLAPSDSLITYYRISNNKVKLQVHLLFKRHQFKGTRFKWFKEKSEARKID